MCCSPQGHDLATEQQYAVIVHSWGGYVWFRILTENLMIKAMDHHHLRKLNILIFIKRYKQNDCPRVFSGSWTLCGNLMKFYSQISHCILLSVTQINDGKMFCFRENYVTL